MFQHMVLLGIVIAPLFYGVISYSETGKDSSLTQPSPPAAGAAIVISPDSSVLAVGETVALQATVLDADRNSIKGTAASRRVSGTTVARISAVGVVTGLGAGQATVTTGPGDELDTARVWIRAPVAPVDSSVWSDTSTTPPAPSPVPPSATFLRPFSANSPWNTPLSSYQSVRYTPTNAFKSFDPAMASWPGASWVAISQAKSTDPVVTLYFNPNSWINVANGVWKRSGNTPSVETQIRAGMDQQWEGYQFNPYSLRNPSVPGTSGIIKQRTDLPWSLTAHVPAGAVPPPDADGHMAIFQPNGSVLEVMGTIRMTNGDIVCLFASYTDPAGFGTGNSNGRRATMIPNYAGVLRDGELSSGQINHALAITIGAGAIVTSAVAPATAIDRDTADYSGTLPMGSLLAIPAGTNLADLGLQTAQGKTLAKAAQQYGMYIVDRAGPRYFIIASEQHVTDVPGWNPTLDSDLRIIRDNLQLTTVAPVQW